MTLDETRRTLNVTKETLRGLHLPSNLVEAASDSELSGIAMKFVQETKRAGRPIDPEEYFNPYTRNLISILGGNPGHRRRGGGLSAPARSGDFLDSVFVAQVRRFDLLGVFFGPGAQRRERVHQGAAQIGE